MSSGFAEHLTKLTDADLAEVLESRPDVRTVPAPGTFEQLAHLRNAQGDFTVASIESVAPVA